jgi:hypothetical protein
VHGLVTHGRCVMSPPNLSGSVISISEASKTASVRSMLAIDKSHHARHRTRAGGVVSTAEPLARKSDRPTNKA